MSSEKEMSCIKSGGSNRTRTRRKRNLFWKRGLERSWEDSSNGKLHLSTFLLDGSRRALRTCHKLGQAEGAHHTSEYLGRRRRPNGTRGRQFCFRGRPAGTPQNLCGIVWTLRLRVAATQVTSVLHIQTAITQALLAAAQNTLRTKTVHSELIWALNPSNNVSKAYRFSCLVARIDSCSL